MKRRAQILLFIIGIFCIPMYSYAQVDFNRTPDDDLGNFEDNFQQHFFEALKQKGIENYNKALKELQICLQIDDSRSVVYFEMGKNYVQLKNYGDAEEVLKKAISMDQDNEWYLDELYGVYYEIDDFDNALKTVKQLVKYHPDYKEDLANLYFHNKKYKAALITLDEIDKEYGVSESRDILRNKIYNETGRDNERIEYLEERISNNPRNESNYLNLIYRYSEQGDKEKAFETAKSLLQNIPNSHLVHLALYKFYLDDNNEVEAITSMKIVLNSPKIKPEAKAMVLNDFVKFVEKHPNFESELLEITTDVVNDESGKSNAELGQYYLTKGNKDKALQHFTIALEKESENFEIIKNVILLQIDLEEFYKAEELSKNGLELFPSQPLLYLLNGVANNKLNKPKDALDALEMGVDYVLDDIKMLIDFYTQLSIAHRLNNNISKSEAFSKKAQALQNKQ